MKTQPLYAKIRNRILEMIRQDLAVGDFLPSERQLVQLTGASRTTVRLALQDLEAMGVIGTRHGKGRYVIDSQNKAVNLKGMYSFTDHMQTLGYTPTSQIIAYWTEKSLDLIQDPFQGSQAEPALCFKRLRLADQTVMMVERTYLPLRVFPDLDPMDIESRPMYDIFIKDYNQSILTIEEELRAGRVSPEDAEFLGVEPGSPVLEIYRKSFNPKNRLIELTQSIARSDKFTYKTIYSN